MCKRGPTGIWSQLPGIRPICSGAESDGGTVIVGSCGGVKTDTKRAYSYGDMGDDVVNIRPPDWWPEPIPEGHVFLLLKSIFGTLQAARKWHTHISTWMEKNGYEAMNSEKTLFMKRKGSEYIIHGLFVDDMMHIYTSDAMKDEFLALYKKEITGGGKMETFLGMEAKG